MVIFLRKKSWGKGYATEVAKTLVSVCFGLDSSESNSTKLIKEDGHFDNPALTSKDNHASQRVLFKIGMKLKQFPSSQALEKLTFVLSPSTLVDLIVFFFVSSFGHITASGKQLFYSFRGMKMETKLTSPALQFLIKVGKRLSSNTLYLLSRTIITD